MRENLSVGALRGSGCFLWTRIVGDELVTRAYKRWLVLFVLIPCSFAIGSVSAGQEWPLVGGDAGNQRYSSLSQINTKNVSKLAGAWVRELDTKSRTAPVVVDGVLYTNDAVKIYALNAKTGETIWEHKPEGSTPARGGVAVAEGKVFSGLVDTHVIALDQKTGKLLWRGFMGNVSSGGDDKKGGRNVNLGFNPKVGVISAAPTYLNGKVILGLSGGDAGTPGKIAALDANTGELSWEWWVMPGPGEPGSETWPAKLTRDQLGGGAVWTHGAADPKLGLVYFGTGNAAPAAGGELRPGDNLYMASIVALDVNTGKLKWYHQLTHHDIWEMDVPTPPILYRFKENGKSRPAVAMMRTDGYLFVFDRATGEPLVPIEERPVKQDIRQRTAPTQPFPVGADQFGPNCAEKELIPYGFTPGCFFDPIFYDRPDIILPYINVRQAPMSYNPETGYIYVAGGSSPWWFRRVTNPTITLARHPVGAKEYGLIAAIDSQTLKIVWQKRSPWLLAGGSGILTTAGGLMFRLEGDGNVLAFDAKTGESLWTFQTGSLPGPNVLGLTGGAPMATYEISGDQYVVAPVGKELWSFKLNGGLGSRPAPPVPPTEYGFQGIVKTLGSGGEIQMAATQPFPGLTPESTSTDQLPEYIDEISFHPVRARVRRGHSVKFTNYGIETHTIVTADGSWTTGPVAPGQSVSVTIDKPGKYTYYASEFPWSKGQLVVQ